MSAAASARERGHGTRPLHPPKSQITAPGARTAPQDAQVQSKRIFYGSELSHAQRDHLGVNLVPVPPPAGRPEEDADPAAAAPEAGDPGSQVGWPTKCVWSTRQGSGVSADRFALGAQPTKREKNAAGGARRGV